MDALVKIPNRATLTVIAGPVKERRGGKFFKREVIPPDEYGRRIIYPGMVVAESGSYYVPYNASAAYGTGSDVPVGILNEAYDLSLMSKMVSPVTEGTFIRAHCYVFGGQLGVIPGAVEAALRHIQWK